MKKTWAIILFALLFCMGLVFSGCSGCSGCSEDEGAKSITNLTYNGEMITWTSVKNAKNYKVVINNGTESVVSQAEGTISYRYNSNGEDFDFFVEAVIKEGSDKNPTYSIRFQNIGQVQGLAIADGKLTWTAMEAAEKYEIMYNGSIVASDVGAPGYPTQPGEFSYKVRALKGQAESVDGNIPYFSLWSDVITGEVLATPQKFVYDSEAFTWEMVPKATSYIIKIGNEQFTTTGNRYEYAAGNESFAASVCAVGNEAQKIYSSQFSAESQYTFIPPVEGLNIVDGVLKWTASENAVRYKVKVNGIVSNEELTTNEFAGLHSGGSFRIQVLPVGKDEFTFSRWSNEITVNILRSPVVSYADGVVRWNQVAGCSGYEIKIEKDNAIIHTSEIGAETFVYNYAFEDAGDYLVSVKALSLGMGGVYESKYSTPYSVKRLAAPTNEKLENRPLEQNQISVSFTPVTGATSYALLADGVEIATIRTGSTFSVDLSKMTSKTEESVVSFEIIARGGVTTEGAVLDCKVPLKFNATKLATPQNLTISGTQISWDSVNHTSKYVLTIDGKRTEVTTTTFTLTDLAAGTHNIYVQAMGNGEDVITGGFSNALSVKKLATPTNVQISNGLLTWGIVDGATAYKVVLGSTTYNADGASFDLLGYSSYISEGVGTQISVYAIGNGSDTIDSDVSATKTFSKYSRPSTVKVNGDSLVWNPSSVDGINCNAYKLIISKDGGQEYEDRFTGSSYAMSNFDAGSYTVKVVAIGDLKTTVDSPASDTFSFIKLADITNVVKIGDTYTWDAVIGATKYEIKLSKDATWTVVNEPSYKPEFTGEGVFEVSIRAIGNGADIIDSNVYFFEQRVSRMLQPVRQDSLSNNNAFSVSTVGNMVTVTMNMQSGATGYKLFVDGIERDSNLSGVLSFAMQTPGATYKIQVQVLGGGFSDTGIYMIDSNKSTEVAVTYQS